MSAGYEMEDKTKILIVDDHRVVIEGIRSALKEVPEFELVGEAMDGQRAVELAASLTPDIVIMDISMPGLGGLEATLQLKRSLPDIQIVVFTIYSDRQHVIALFKAGVSAYVLKQDPLSDLILALKAVKSGGTYFSKCAPKLILGHVQELEATHKPKDDLEKLSPREVEVFILLADGMSVKNIAVKLYISPKTVESHKYNILQKLNLSTPTDLTKIAIRKNLINP